MTDHAHELRRYARKIAHPAGDVPSVMLAAADEIERLAAKLEAAEKEVAHIKEVEFPRKARAVAVGWETKCVRLEQERTIDEQRIADLMAELNRVGQENEELRAKITEMERQEPVGVLHVGSYYGEELQDWEFEANQGACDKLNEAYISNPTSLPLYALPGAKGEEK